MRILRYGMRGADVMKIQSALKKTGFYTGAVDGIYGPVMRSAVYSFQKAFGLKPDGVIGARTYNALQRYITGADRYTVRPGDTYSGIAQRYYTKPELIAAANPGTDPRDLRPGQVITVPYGYDVVDTDIDYTYDALQADIRGLKARYPFIETGSAGKSALGRDLTWLKLGSGSNQVFYSAAIHALEWITAPVMMKFIEDFSKAYAAGTDFAGYDPKKIWESSAIHIIPMANPDGVDLVINGLKPTNPNYYKLIRWNNGSMDFSSDWEANNNGVDLNHNFDAAWEESKEAAEAMGITGPGPTRYPGPYPESEPESRALADFTRGRDFRLVLAYHTQGEVIYWTFMGLEPPESKPIGERLAEASGYELAEPSGITAYGGYKDWFIKEFRRPGYTVEAGLGRNPLPVSQFRRIYADNLPLLLLASVITLENPGG